jgi:hypothetical protein
MQSGRSCGCLVTGDSAYDAEVAWRSYRNLDPELLTVDADLAARRTLAVFERLIASHPKAAHTGLFEPMESRHRELSARVRQIHDAHERMARHHAEVGSRMADLERATSAPL